MKTFIALTLIAALGGTSAGLWFHFFPRSHELRLPGTVESQEVRLSSRVGGRVSKVYVDDGAVLEAGAKIIDLEMPELDAQRAQLVAQKNAAEANVAKLVEGPRKQEIAAAKAAVDASKARLDLMNAGFRPEETEQVAGDLAAARADLANARVDMDRERNLLNQKATSQQNFDAAVAKYGRLSGQVSALDAKHRMYSKGYRDQEKAEAEAELARLQANLDLLYAGTRDEDKDEARAQVAQLDGKLAELDVMRAERTVFAPEKCVVQTVSVRPGDIAAPNRPVALVLRADDLWVKAYISEIQMGLIKVGQKVEVTMDTFPNKRFSGEVIYIAPQSEFTPRNVQTVDERRHQVFGVKVRVADPQGVFKAGMAADVWLKK
ncbi:HlyD family secretion protein [Anatilimnocola floriformis]|uniref:HlyD family secretion protein n=1 Tax=Anatilimnocola floriformis TaxID=2948575 RepID=UPI0020C2630A|nr:efflux RND transporter periplasmic adaptor subunit [Anatilimnocola floriformis]